MPRGGGIFRRRARRRDEDEDKPEPAPLKKHYHLRLLERNNWQIFIDEQLPFTNCIMLTLGEKEMKKTILETVWRYFPVHLMPSGGEINTVMKSDRTPLDITQPVRTVFNDQKRGIVLIDFRPMLTPEHVRLAEAHFVEKAAYLRELYVIPNWFEKTMDGERIFWFLEYMSKLNLRSKEEDDVLKAQVAVLHVTSLVEAAYNRPRNNNSTRNKVIVSVIVMLLLISQFLYQMIHFGGPLWRGEDLEKIDIPTWY